MGEEGLELPPGSPNNGEDGGRPPEGHEAEVPEGDVSTLPEWAQKRLNTAEGHIVDLKKTAGVPSVKALKDKLAPPKPPEKPDAPKAQETTEHVTRDELTLLRKGYEPEELEIARRLSPGKSLTEAVEDEVAKAAIAGLRAKRQTNDSIPEPSDRVPVLNGKTYNELSPQEKKTKYAGTVSALVDKGRGRSARQPGR